MSPALISQLLLAQANTLIPHTLSADVKLCGLCAAEDGPESLSVDPDEIGQERPFNFLAVYEAAGRQSVSVMVHLMPGSDRWQLYPDRSYFEVKQEAEAAPVSSHLMPWMINTPDKTAEQAQSEKINLAKTPWRDAQGNPVHLPRTVKCSRA